LLETDGIVTIHPRAGIEFIKPGLELTRATYQFRGIIESSAVAVYAETADDAEMLEVEPRHLQAVAALETDGLTPAIRGELETLEEVLHNAIIASLRNPLIDTSYRRIHNYLRILRLDRKITVPLALRSLREHLSIIQACRHRNPAEATSRAANTFRKCDAAEHGSVLGKAGEQPSSKLAALLNRVVTAPTNAFRKAYSAVG